jgi:hypothetical protein
MMRHVSTRAEKQAWLDTHRDLWTDLDRLVPLATASKLWACHEPVELTRSIATQLRARVTPRHVEPRVHSRQYGCGCVQVGADPLPARCPVHDTREAIR